MVDKYFIASRLRERREYLGITRQQVAEALGIGVTGYGHKETGRNEISSTELSVLADLLHVPIAYFYGEGETEDVAEDEFLQFYYGCPPEQKAQARRVLEALFAVQDAEASRHAPKTHGKRAK